MKITSMVLATSLALVPATVALADDAKKEALKKAKEAAKEKAIERAKEKTEKKTEKAQEKAATKIESKKEAEADKAKAAEEEKQTHAKNLGSIERLQQIAEATSNEDLKKAVAKLNETETQRHKLAAGEA